MWQTSQPPASIVDRWMLCRMPRFRPSTGEMWLLLRTPPWQNLQFVALSFSLCLSSASTPGIQTATIPTAITDERMSSLVFMATSLLRIDRARLRLFCLQAARGRPSEMWPRGPITGTVTKRKFDDTEKIPGRFTGVFFDDFECGDRRALGGGHALTFRHRLSRRQSALVMHLNQSTVSHQIDSAGPAAGNEPVCAGRIVFHIRLRQKQLQSLPHTARESLRNKIVSSRAAHE